MNDNATIRRILLVVEPVDAQRATLESAVRFAAALKADLESLFLEDEQFFEAICGPAARLVHAQGAATAVADFNLVRRSVKVRATQTREVLAAAAAQWAASYTFTTVHGRVWQYVPERGDAPDMVMLIAPTRRAGSLPAFIESVYHLCQCLSSPLLLLRPNVPLDRSVYVVFGGRPAALHTAAELAAKLEAPLRVFVSGDSQQAIEANEQATWRLLDEHAIHAELQPLPPGADVAALDIEQPGLLVVDRAPMVASVERLRTLLSERRSSILLVP